MPRRFVLAALVAAASATAAPAYGLEVLEPVNGATVPPAPTFRFDFTEGYVYLQVSRSPDVQTSGSDAGRFVEFDELDIFILEASDPTPGSATWSETSPAGSWYWHARMEDRASDTERWSDVRRFTVLDGPPSFNGWTLRTQRLRKRKGCPRRWRVEGAIAFSDNAEVPKVRYSVRLSVGRKVKRLRGKIDRFSNAYSGTVCLPAGTLKATAAIRDPAGHFAEGPVKSLRLR